MNISGFTVNNIAFKVLVASITDATHFCCLYDNYRLVNMSQTVSVMCIHSFTTLQNATKVDVTRATPIPIFTDTSSTKCRSNKYLQVQVPIPILNIINIVKIIMM